MKKLLKTIIVLGILGAAGYLGYQWYVNNGAAPVATRQQSAYTEYTIGPGTLSKSVTGTGTLSIGRTQDVALPYAVTVTATLVEEGDTVTKGQQLMLIDTAALQTTIDELQTTLETTESEIAALTDEYNNAEYLKLTMDCRVKEVYISAGDYIQDVMAQKGSIMLLSLDGMMYVEVPVIEGLDILDEVKVTVGKVNVEGVVRSIEGNTMTITFTDAYGAQGQEVSIRYRDKIVATGRCYIHMPYYYTTSAEGYIELVNVEPNAKKYSGNRICYLNNIPISSTYNALTANRQTQAAQLAQMKVLLKEGCITAPADGIVSTVTAPSATAQEAYTTLCSLYVGDEKEMVISVDELDIISVREGQQVDVAMDAIEDKTYSAVVSKVSQIGTASGGVTVYNVTLSVEGDDRLKVGMNGTATVHIEQLDDVLLVPLAALNTSRGQSYVWVKTDADTGDEPGVRTAVETGLSDENTAQVISGLNEGDVVLITREASTDSNTQMPQGFGMGSMPDMGGFGMPSGGGTRPSNGGQRQSGGGR